MSPMNACGKNADHLRIWLCRRTVKYWQRLEIQAVFGLFRLRTVMRSQCFTPTLSFTRNAENLVLTGNNILRDGTRQIMYARKRSTPRIGSVFKRQATQSDNEIEKNESGKTVIKGWCGLKGTGRTSRDVADSRSYTKLKKCRKRGTYWDAANFCCSDLCGRLPYDATTAAAGLPDASDRFAAGSRRCFFAQIASRPLYRVSVALSPC
jgi:hypothetical protein